MNSPADEYRRRLAARQAMAETVAARVDRLGQWRVGAVLLGVAVFLAAQAGGWFSSWWAALSLVPVGVLFVLDVRLSGHRRWYERLARYYDLGLRRLNGDWPGTGTTGERFLDPVHLAAVDLDLFGNGSLFERLCTARTAEGEKRLADWLLAPASAEVVTERQRAVRELRGRLDLRENLAATGAEAVGGVDVSRLIRWGEARRSAPPSWRVRAVFVLGWVNVLTCGAWVLAGAPPALFVLTFIVSAVIALPLSAWAKASVAAVEDNARHLAVLAGVLSRFERETFADPLLTRTQARLRVENVTASGQIGELSRLAEWLAARRNPMFLPIRLLLLWDVRMAELIGRWRATCGERVRDWCDAVAELEALSSLAAYSYENPDDPFPTVTAGPPRFDGTGLGHPLMDAAKCVRNDVRLDDATRALVVSGSNMSGKSTLLRTVGVNAVLSLAGGPVRAAALTLSPLRVTATLRVQDSLSDGRSRFFAEVVRVRAAIDAARSGPTLFLFDELFAGTNSADRVRGAVGVIRALLDAGAVGLVTTHDLAVTELPPGVREIVRNVHFADQWTAGEMTFDHAMRPGVVPHTNGVALMRAVGLEV